MRVVEVVEKAPNPSTMDKKLHLGDFNQNDTICCGF